MELTGKQLECLRDAILGAYPTEHSLSELVMFDLGEELHAIVSDGNLRQVVFELIKWFKARGRLEELITKAHQRNPGNKKLADCVKQIETGEGLDLSQLRTDYLAYLQDRFRRLDLKGMPQIPHITHCPDLQEIFVPLKAYPAFAQSSFRIAGRRWQDKTGPDADLVLTREDRNERIPMATVFAQYPAVVVLGDPGAGKSTLLKVQALTLADRPDGPLPIFMPLNTFARRLGKEEVSLEQYLAEYYTTRRKKLAGIDRLFSTALRKQQAVILLDGLDEVQDNRNSLVQFVQEFVTEHVFGSTSPNGYDPADPSSRPGNQVIVTSRIVGYDETPLTGQPWRTYILADFEQPDIKQFVCNWTLAFAKTTQGESIVQETAETESAALLAAISSRPSIEQLAANPLLLTILALIKYYEVDLPSQRVELYESYLKTLIKSWPRARDVDRHSVESQFEYEDAVRILASMALWLREENPTAGLIKRNALEHWLSRYFQNEEGDPRGTARRRARGFLKEMEESAGLLIKRGERQYGFLHLALEEMLAAQGIVYLMDEDRSAGLALFDKHVLDSIWYEVIQLAIGFIGLIRRDRAQAGVVLKRLLQELPGKDINRQVVFVGQTLLDAGRTSVSPAVAKEIKAALLKTMQSPVLPTVRSEAGYILGRLGDPRQDIVTLPLSFTEAIEGELKYGTGKKLRMVNSFKAGVYPVTNAQFGLFIESDGYHTKEWWSEEGWFWRHAKPHYPNQSLNCPDYWHDKRFNNPNQPVVGITWYEAEAFCRWLSNKYEGKYRLPTEAEWELLARGPVENEYPWGNEWQKDISNTQESGIGQTSAVGIFQEGVSPVGVYDCAGNVWEWCDDWYDDQARKVLRGGAWNFDKEVARCWARSGDFIHGGLNNVGFRVIQEP